MKRRWLFCWCLMLISGGCVAQNTSVIPPTSISTLISVPQPTQTATPIPATEVVVPPTPTPSPTASTISSLESVRLLHVVEAGDTLSEIADLYQIPLAQLMADNRLTTDLIFVGQILTITLSTGNEEQAINPPEDQYTLPLSPTAALITSGSRVSPHVALTFDACQTERTPSGYDEEIIAVLLQTQTPATFFLGGLWMQSHPTQTQFLAENPLFELGNHSWSHPDFAAMTPEEMTFEITMTQRVLYELTGKRATLFRLPFGTYTEQALATIAEQGLLTIQWDVVTGDPDPNISADAIVRTVVQQTRNGSIIIMHVNGRGWHTAEALPTMIAELQALGFTFVTVSQLLQEAPLVPS